MKIIKAHKMNYMHVHNNNNNNDDNDDNNNNKQ